MHKNELSGNLNIFMCPSGHKVHIATKQQVTYNCNYEPNRSYTTFYLYVNQRFKMITQVLKFYLFSECCITQCNAYMFLSEDICMFIISTNKLTLGIEFINMLNYVSEGKMSHFLKYAFRVNVNIDSKQRNIFAPLYL